MNTEINKSSNNTNNKLLLPPKTSQKKTLVLDLDETLVHSQFNTFSSPSDVTIKIEVDNEIHDIHVMVRPGVKEFLQDMEKTFEIVIFTASVSKYADPLLDIIDKNGYCPFRLFREHCSLINTTFVKDLERLGRDLKDIIIVDNSPLSYSLHPDNGLPILTWFEDKNDTELFKLKPVLEFLSYVPDVRDFIPKFIGENNKINYEKTKEIINGYKGPKYIVQDKENENKNNNKKNLKINPKEIHVNIEIVDKNSNNNALRKRNNKNKTNEKKSNKNYNKKYHDKLATLDIKSIIANVSPDSIIQNIDNNQNLLNKKRISYKKKLENKNNDKKLNNEKFIKINLNNFINVKKSNNNSYSPKNKIYKKSNSEKKFKILQNKRISNSAGANRIKKSLNKINTNNKTIYLYINKNNNNKNQFKLNNQTPKMNKTINLVSNNLYTTRSDKCNQKTNNYIKEKNYIRNNISLYDKISKSDYKNTLNIEKAIKKDNTIYNKIKHNNTIYKTFTSNINYISPKKKKIKSNNNFKPLKGNKKPKVQNSSEKIKKLIKKIEIKKIKNNNFLKNNSTHQKINYYNNPSNINNLTNNLSFSNKFHNLNEININSIDYLKTNKTNNQIKLPIYNNIFINDFKINKKYTPSKRYKKITFSLNKNINCNSHNNINKNKSLNLKKNKENNISSMDKEDNNKREQNKNLNYNNLESEVINSIKGVKTNRPKSSSTSKFVVNNYTSKEKQKNIKYPTKKLEINDILQKRGIYNKNNSIKNSIKNN